MRYSSEPYDPGYANWKALIRQGKTVEVYRNDLLVKDCVTADDVLGIVVTATHDGYGYIQYDYSTDTFPKITYEGTVTFKIIKKPSSFIDDD